MLHGGVPSWVRHSGFYIRPEILELISYLDISLAIQVFFNRLPYQKIVLHYNLPMSRKPQTSKPRYTDEHAQAGLDYAFPEIETWPNQFPAYEIVVDVPEFTSVCPKTGLPDFGVITIRYVPAKRCLELKSLKEYLFHYRNLGIFQENIVNRVLEDVVRAAKPVSAEVRGDFRPRGGLGTVVEARWPRPRRKS